MTRKMYAAVVEQFGKPLAIQEWDIPSPGAGQILVETEACGVCHSDLHAARGDWPLKPTLPFIPGHEGIGRVVAVGAGVTVLGSILGSIFPVSASATVSATVDSTLTAPFSATVETHLVRVRARPENDSPEVGLLRQGAMVTVTACQPDCGAPHAWAVLGADGAVKMELLNSKPVRVEASTEPTPESLWYGRVGKSGIKIFKEPRLHGPLLTRKRLSREMAFLPNVELRRSGWFERIEGGFVRAGQVQILTPSLFHGEALPHLPFAFVIRKISPAGGQPERLHRYDRVAVRGIDSAHIATDRGLLPRSALRIVALHSPPPSIPAGAKWILVDLSQQTMTAYEGETAVFATLISSGKVHEETETYAGLYQVEHKMLYSDMHGEPDDPYDVDRVPYVLYFHESEGLHGTYWHDHFGTRESHGCVNLSLADARWLFDWAPPKLPEGWSTIDPGGAGLTSLWVLVEKQSSLTQVPQISPAALISAGTESRENNPAQRNGLSPAAAGD